MRESKLTTWQKHDALISAGYAIVKDEDGVWHVVQLGPGGYTVYSARYKGLAVTSAYDLLT